MSRIWTRMLVFSGRKILWQIKDQSIWLMLCVFALSSCGPVSSVWDSISDKPQKQQQQPGILYPDPSLAPTAAPLNTPPALNNRPKAEMKGVHSATGDPRGQWTERGLNADILFAEDIRGTRRRFERLESAVTELSREFNQAMPAITRLISVESDLAQMIENLETLMSVAPPEEPAMLDSMPPQGTSPAVYAQTATPPAEQAPPAVENTPAKAVPGISQVHRLRIGEHKDKTRIVLDLNKSAPYRYDLDNSENLLVIELPETEWAAQRSWSGHKAPLIDSYTVQPMKDGKGSRVIIALKHNASVKKELAIKPNGYADYRIVLDITSPNIHN